MPLSVALPEPQAFSLGSGNASYPADLTVVFPNPVRSRPRLNFDGSADGWGYAPSEYAAAGPGAEAIAATLSAIASKIDLPNMTVSCGWHEVVEHPGYFLPFFRKISLLGPTVVLICGLYALET